MIITPAKVQQFIHTVSSEQIGRCSKIIDNVNGNFYKVLSESDDLTEYTVRFSKKHGFTCTCQAGQEGFAHCSRGFCKHVLWSVACEQEIRQAVAALELEALAEQIAAAAKPEPIYAKLPNPDHQDEQVQWTAAQRRESNRLNRSRERGRLAILESVAMARNILQ